MILTDNFAISFAKEFTITAIEHSLIPSSDDPIKAADNVTAFFNRIADTLSCDSSEN